MVYQLSLRFSAMFKTSVCFLSRKERVVHQESRPCMGSKEWLMSEVHSIPPTVYNRALNQEPDILKQMNSRS